MPVRLDEYYPDSDSPTGAAKSDVVAFLYDNPQLGFRPSEISDRLDLPHRTARKTLIRLREDDLVSKTQDSYYHARQDCDDIHRYLASFDQLVKMFEEKEAQDPTTNDVDEDDLDAEIAELEAELESLKADIDE